MMWRITSEPDNEATRTAGAIARPNRRWRQVSMRWLLLLTAIASLGVVTAWVAALILFLYGATTAEHHAGTPDITDLGAEALFFLCDYSLAAKIGAVVGVLSGGAYFATWYTPSQQRHGPVVHVAEIIPTVPGKDNTD